MLLQLGGARRAISGRKIAMRPSLTERVELCVDALAKRRTISAWLRALS